MSTRQSAAVEAASSDWEHCPWRNRSALLPTAATIHHGAQGSSQSGADVGPIPEILAITLMMRHPSAPFTAVVNDLDDGTLQSVALSYLRCAISLETIEPRLELPGKWLMALETRTERRHSESKIEWLRIQWPRASDKEQTTGNSLAHFAQNAFTLITHRWLIKSSF